MSGFFGVVWKVLSWAFVVPWVLIWLFGFPAAGLHQVGLSPGLSLALAISFAGWLGVASALRPKVLDGVAGWVVWLAVPAALFFAYVAFLVAWLEVAPPETSILDRPDPWKALGAHLLSGLFLPVLALLALIPSARKAIQTGRHMDLLAASSVGGGAVGLAEVNGTLEPDPGEAPLETPIERTAAVLWSKRKRRQSKNGPVWDVVETKRCRFSVVGDGVRVRIGEGAWYRGTTWEYASEREAANFLAPGTPVYVFGETRIDPETGDRLVFEKDPESPIQLVVSAEGEESVRAEMAGEGESAVTWSYGAIVAGALAILPLFGLGTITFLAAAAVVPLVATLGSLAALRINDLVILRNLARRARANVDVSLAKRGELVPKLEALTKAAAAHERRLLDELTALRESWSPDLPSRPGAVEAFCRAEAAFVGDLLGVAEAHPDLVADEGFRDLSRELVRLENELAMLGHAHIGAVRQYDDRIGIWPDRLVAGLLGFRPLPRFDIPLEVREMPATLRGPSS